MVSYDVNDLFIYCKNVGEMFNLKNVNDFSCNKFMYGNCVIGDMMFKYGKIEVLLVIKM